MVPRLSVIVALGALLLAAPLRAGEPPPEAILADLPFLDSDEVNRIYVDLAPEGKKRRLPILLDTGAVFSVFTPRAARAAGVHIRRAKAGPYRRATALGRDLLFYVDAERSDTGSRTGSEYGLLGGNFLADYVLELDFHARRVRFLDPKRYEVPETVDAPGEAVIPLEMVSSRPGLTIELNGKATTVLLDTGAPDALVLSGKLARAAAIESAPLPGFGMAGVMGNVESEFAEVERMQIGPFGFEGVPAGVAPRGWHNLGFPGDSVLGYDVLAQFHVRIDYRRKRLWLRRDPEARMTLFGVDYDLYRKSGALLVPARQGFHVYAVRPGSRAEARGVRPWDFLATSESATHVVAGIMSGGALQVIRSVDEAPVEVVLEAEEGSSPAAAHPSAATDGD
jgi:predicted aspartyl protease